jgi:hypothetical protein
MEPEAARYFSRREEMAARVEATFLVVSWPLAYLVDVSR